MKVAVVVLAFGIISLAYAIITQTGPKTEPPREPSASITVCAVNQGYYGIRFRMFVGPETVRDAYMAPDEVECGYWSGKPGTYSVRVACDAHVLYDQTLTLLDGDDVELPRPGYMYVCR